MTIDVWSNFKANSQTAFGCTVEWNKVKHYPYYISLHSWTTYLNILKESAALKSSFMISTYWYTPIDTIILSISLDGFIQKCNEAVNFFSKNKSNLNIDKSCFLIINPKSEDRRLSIILNSGVLKYKPKFHYLGVIISDSGLLKEDVKSFVLRKNGNVSVKFTNQLL